MSIVVFLRFFYLTAENNYYVLSFYKIIFGVSSVARIVRACGARCGIKTKFLWSNGGGGRNPEKPGFGW